jgi:hypothetical protein
LTSTDLEDRDRHRGVRPRLRPDARGTAGCIAVGISNEDTASALVGDAPDAGDRDEEALRAKYRYE